MRYAGGPERLAATFAERHAKGQHQDAIDECRHFLRRCFCDGDGVEGHERDGPIKAAIFKYGEKPDPQFQDAVVRERREVAGIVNAFLMSLERTLNKF
jgi:hypothetical protein